MSDKSLTWIIVIIGLIIVFSNPEILEKLRFSTVEISACYETSKVFSDMALLADVWYDWDGQPKCKDVTVIIGNYWDMLGCRDDSVTPQRQLTWDFKLPSSGEVEVYCDWDKMQVICDGCVERAECLPYGPSYPSYEKCVGQQYYVCGSDRKYVLKGLVNGKCGYTVSPVTINSIDILKNQKMATFKIQWSGGVSPYTVELEYGDGNVIYTQGLATTSYFPSYTYPSIGEYHGSVCVYDSDSSTENDCEDFSITISSACNTNADTNCDNIVDRTELGVSIDGWIAGTVTRDALGQAIVAWIGTG